MVAGGNAVWCGRLQAEECWAVFVVWIVSRLWATLALCWAAGCCQAVTYLIRSNYTSNLHLKPAAPALRPLLTPLSFVHLPELEPA